MCGQISKVVGLESGIQTMWVLQARYFLRFNVLLAVFNPCYMVHSLCTMTLTPTKNMRNQTQTFHAF